MHTSTQMFEWVTIWYTYIPFFFLSYYVFLFLFFQCFHSNQTESTSEKGKRIKKEKNKKDSGCEKDQNLISGILPRLGIQTHVNAKSLL